MEFKYIDVAFGKIKKQITDFEKTIFLSGIECAGKSYVLEKVGKYYSSDKVILPLTSTSVLENLEYGVFIAALSRTGEYSQALSVATGIISEKNKTFGLVSEFLVNYKKNQLKYQLISFSEVEIDILNRISLICKKSELLILADDVDKWDSESKKLLGKLIALQNDLECSFIKDTVLIFTAKSVESLDLNIGSCFHIEIECNLSYNSFSEEARKLKISSEQTIHELYDITNGNIGLIANIKKYIDVSSLTRTESIQKQLFQILEKRIDSSKKISDEVLSTLQTATVIGKEFNLIYLTKLLEQPIGELDYHIEIGCDEKFVTKQDSENQFSFSTDTLYSFFVSKLNGRSTDYHYKFAKILEKISPYQFYLRYFHMNLSGNVLEAIPLLTIHCIRQCMEGCDPSEISLEILHKHDNYWNVYQNISQSIKNYRTGTNYTQYYDLIESSDLCVDPMVNIEKDYVLCLLKYRTGNINDFNDIESILAEYFDGDTDFSQHIRIGMLLFLLYCNRLSNYEKAKKVEKTITKQIQQELVNCLDLEKEIRIMERLSPALYANEIAYVKTRRSLNFFEDKRTNYSKEYIMSLTNFLGVGIYLVGTTVDSELSWESLFTKACKGIEFLNNVFNMNIYGIPKLINNYILVGILSRSLTFQEGIELFDSLLSENGHIPSRALLECNQMILKFLDGEKEEILVPMKELFLNTKAHEYYHFIIGINYLNILIVNRAYKDAEIIFDELNYVVPTISLMDDLYIKKHYDMLKIIIAEKKQYSSIEEYCQYFEKSIHLDESPFPDVWRKASIFSDLQYWSEY